MVRKRPTSYHKLNFPIQIFHGKVFYICIVVGRSYLGHFSPPSLSFHGLILHMYICRARLGLQNAGSGWARALHCGLGLFAGLGAYLVKLGSGSGFY
jgi:hypothetical protein